MSQVLTTRAQRTRERLRAAAHRLFLRQGYQATSIEAILAEASVSSKETFYRHYATKEALFVDVLGSLTLAEPGFVARLAALPEPHDLPALQQALTRLSREIAAMITQPGYLPLVRMILTESARFPQLSGLFFATVTQRGLSLVARLLRSAREQRLIAADLDLDAVTRTWLGGLLASVLMSVALAEELDQRVIGEHVDAVIVVIMRALRL